MMNRNKQGGIWDGLLLPPTVDRMRHFWEQVETETPFIDANNSVFTDSWVQRSGKYAKGMKYRCKQERHGVVSEKRGDYHDVGTFKRNKAHGLNMQVRDEVVIIRLFDEGEVVAGVDFDYDFRQIGRYGPMKHVLKDVFPTDFQASEPVNDV